MYLGINTASNLLTLVVAKPDGSILLNHAEPCQASHSTVLLPRLQALLREHSLTIHDIQGIICARGPGSFTGIRIGLTSANSLAYALKIPLVGIDNLQLLRAHLLDQYHHDLSAFTHSAVLLDAGRAEVYLLQTPLNNIQTANALNTSIKLLKVAQLQFDPSTLIGGIFRSPLLPLLEPIILNNQLTKLFYIDREPNLGQYLIQLGLPLLAETPAFTLDHQLTPLYIREASITQSKKTHL